MLRGHGSSVSGAAAAVAGAGQGALHIGVGDSPRSNLAHPRSRGRGGKADTAGRRRPARPQTAAPSAPRTRPCRRPTPARPATRAPALPSRPLRHGPPHTVPAAPGNVSRRTDRIRRVRAVGGWRTRTCERQSPAPRARREPCGPPLRRRTPVRRSLRGAALAPSSLPRGCGLPTRMVTCRRHLLPMRPQACCRARQQQPRVTPLAARRVAVPWRGPHWRRGRSGHGYGGPLPLARAPPRSQPRRGPTRPPTMTIAARLGRSAGHAASTNPSERSSPVWLVPVFASASTPRSLNTAAVPSRAAARQGLPHALARGRLHGYSRWINEHLPKPGEKRVGQHGRTLDPTRRHRQGSLRRHLRPSERGQHFVQRAPREPLAGSREEDIARQRERLHGAEGVCTARVLAPDAPPADDAAPGHSRRVAGVMAPLSSDAISAGSFIREPGSTGRDISSASCASSLRPVVTSTMRHPMRRAGFVGCASMREARVSPPRLPRTRMAIAAARPAERRPVTRSGRGIAGYRPTSNPGSPAADGHRPPGAG